MSELCDQALGLGIAFLLGLGILFLVHLVLEVGGRISLRKKQQNPSQDSNKTEGRR